METPELFLERRRPKIAEKCCICREIARDVIYDAKSSKEDFQNKICSDCRKKFYLDWKVKEDAR